MKIFKTCLIMTMAFTLLFAGDEARLGTTAGTQVNIPVGARNVAMAGADLVYAHGVDAVYWNPAGMGAVTAANGTFSNMSYIADISVNYLAVGSNFGGFGNIGVSVKSLDFGDIPVTTVEAMDGTGANFSPTFMTMAVTYGKMFTDRINFGVTSKMVYESIPRASASAVAFDIGVQYTDFANINGLGLALVLKNIGSDMHYSGSGLKTQATEDDFTEFFDREAAYDQLPSSYSISGSYKMGGSILLASSFISNNTSYDELRLGGEYTLMNMFSLRAGMNSAMLGSDTELDENDVLFGTSFGFGINYELIGVGFQLDYAYRSTEYFDGNSVLSLGVNF